MKNILVNSGRLAISGLLVASFIAALLRIGVLIQNKEVEAAVNALFRF